MERHTDNVQNLAGDAVSAVTVTVRRVSDNALASLFSDNLAVPTVKANPFTNDADGELFFYAFNNDYNIELSGPVSETRLGVTLWDQNDSPIRRNIIAITASGTISQGVVALVDVTAGAITITLPADPGATVQFSDIVIQHLAGDITANNITIDRNGELIGGAASDVTMDITNSRVVLVWGGSTLGWGIDISSNAAASSLDSLSDVTLTAPGTGEAFVKSAGDWINVDTILATASTLGFFATSPIAQPAAYTQTFATATRTHANPTAAALTDSTGGTPNQTLVAVPVVNGSGATTAQEAAINDNFADVTDEINKLIADLANVKELVNSVIDDGQSYGLLQ